MVLRSFALGRKDSKIFYKYSCCKAKVVNCFEITTKLTDSGDLSTLNLAKQKVDALDNNVFSMIKLLTDNNAFSYKANVCTIG